MEASQRLRERRARRRADGLRCGPGRFEGGTANSFATHLTHLTHLTHPTHPTILTTASEDTWQTQRSAIGLVRWRGLTGFPSSAAAGSRAAGTGLNTERGCRRKTST